MQSPQSRNGLEACEEQENDSYVWKMVNKSERWQGWDTQVLEGHGKKSEFYSKMYWEVTGGF